MPKCSYYLGIWYDQICMYITCTYVVYGKSSHCFHSLDIYRYVFFHKNLRCILSFGHLNRILLIA